MVTTHLIPAALDANHPSSKKLAWRAHHKKPEPLNVQQLGKECPVCHKRSYSAGGIHPQCAVQQADAPRQKLLVEARREQARLAKLAHAEE